MANIFLDCFRHALSYLNEGGGEPPDPGGGGGGGCEGSENCDDDGSFGCDEEFTVVRCVCISQGGLGESNYITDNESCDSVWSCVQEGTNASDLEADVEGCDTGCDGWTNAPFEGDAVCGLPVVTPSPDINCNNFGCASQNCTFYKCEEFVDSETGVFTNECVFSRSIYISAAKECVDFLGPGEYPTDTCNNECPDPPPPPPDTDECGPYYYCANFNNCDDFFNVTVPAGEPCLPTITTSVNGSDQTGYLNKNLCRTAEYGCNNVYDGDPVPQLVVLFDEHLPSLFDLPPEYYCGTPITFQDPDFGLLFIQDEGGETFSLENMTFNPINPDGSDRTDMSFGIDADGVATLTISPGPTGDINTGPFTFEVNGPGIDNVIMQGYPNGDPNVQRNSCDNYPYQCIQLGLCGKTYNDPGGSFGGATTDCNVYGCRWNGQEFVCNTFTKPKSFFGISNDRPCPTAGSKYGTGFAAIIVGDSCPTNFCDQDVVPVVFRRCVTNQGVTTGECVQTTYDIPAHLAETLPNGAAYTRDGFTWAKGACSPGICPNNQFACDTYRCDGTNCIDEVIYVPNENACDGTLPNGTNIAGTCAATGNDICDPPPPPTDNILCDSFQCAGTICTPIPGGSIVTVPEGTECADIKGQLVEGSTNTYVGTCADPGCGGDIEACDVSYCDEQQPPQCQHDSVPANQIFYNGDTLASCDAVPAGTQVAFNGIIGIMGLDCPTACNSSPLPPPPNGSERDNIPERMRKFSDEQLQARANNYLASLARLNNVDDGVLDPVASNQRYIDRRSFVPVRNRYRRDIFADYVHCTVWQLISKNVNNLSVPNAVYSNINLTSLFNSLRRDIRYKLETVKDATGQPIKNGVLRALRLAIINDTLSTFNLNNLPSKGFEDGDYPIADSPDQTGLVKLINEKAKPLDPNFYGGYNKERMRLWKSLAPDLRKAVPLLLEDGTLTYENVNINDTFDVVLSDESLSAVPINPGDIVIYSQSDGRNNAVDLDSDKDRAFMLDRDDYARAFTKMGEKLLTKVEVESPESALIEENYSLSSPRQDLYFLKINLDSIQDGDSDNPLIRVSHVTYDMITDEEEIQEFIQYNPWPFETYYIRPEDPFFDHLEYTSQLSATFKDITFEGLVGYRDDSIIMPRRIPWYITVIPTDDVSKLLSEGKTFLSGYSKRFFYARFLPYKDESKRKWEPSFMAYENQTPRGEGFDPRDNYVGTLKFSYNKQGFKQRENQYTVGKENLPRKETPVRKLLRVIKEVKDTSGSFVDEDSEFIPWPEVYKKMKTSEIQSLKFFEFDSWKEKENQLARNALAKDKTVQTRYSKLSYTPPEKINNYDNYVKPPVTVRATKLDGDFKEETPEPLP